jgi:hypothetical protein
MTIVLISLIPTALMIGALAYMLLHIHDGRVKHRERMLNLRAGSALNRHLRNSEATKDRNAA